MTTTERWVLYGRTCVHLCVIWMVAAVVFLCMSIIDSEDASQWSWGGFVLFVVGWLAAGAACWCEVIADKASRIHRMAVDAEAEEMV